MDKKVKPIKTAEDLQAHLMDSLNEFLSGDLDRESLSKRNKEAGDIISSINAQLKDCEERGVRPEISFLESDPTKKNK